MSWWWLKQLHFTIWFYFQACRNIMSLHILSHYAKGNWEITNNCFGAIYTFQTINTINDCKPSITPHNHKRMAGRFIKLILMPLQPIC